MTPTADRQVSTTVVVAVTGGIAAYKSCELVRRLRDLGLRVRVAMSRAATEFVGPTTLAALSGERVIHSLFDDPRPERIAHVRWAEEASLLCVAPATADFIAKLAHGVGDDFASTLALAAPCPLLIAPAMEDDMYAHPAVQRNLATLRARGAWIIGPASGLLASGRSGPGRMAEAAEIAAAAHRLLHDRPASAWLAGRRVMVTAGPTRERIDPVRALSNRSSGRMGYALAAEAALLGAEVTLVSGPTSLPAPAQVRRIEVESAAEMASAVSGLVDSCDIAVLAAAVADFRPAEILDEKLEKTGRDDLTLVLERTRDILASLAEQEPRPVLVGFAAESSDVERRAGQKLAAKGCDLIVANRIGHEGTGFESQDNAAVVLDRNGGRVEIARAHKRVVAGAVWEAVARFESGSADG